MQLESPQSPQRAPEPLGRRVFKNVVYNFGSAVAARIGGLIFTVVVARLLAPELFGLYALAMALALTVVAATTDFGTGLALSRYLPRALARTQLKRAAGYFRHLFKLRLGFAAASSLAVFLFAQQIAALLFGKPELVEPLRFVSLFVFAYSTLGFFSDLFLALQVVKYGFHAGIVFEVARLAGVFGLFLLTGFSVINAILGVILATFVALGYSIYRALKQQRDLMRGATPALSTASRRELGRFLLFMSAGYVASPIFTGVDTLILGALLTASDVGYYRAASSIAIAIAGLLSFGVVLFPAFSQMGRAQLARAFQRSMRYVLLLAIPAALGLAYIALPLTTLIYGAAYAPAAAPLALLALLIIAQTSFPILGSPMLASKKLYRYYTPLILLGAALNAALSYFLISTLKMVGAALALLAANYTILFASGAILKIKGGLTVSATAILKPLLASAAMLAALFALGSWLGPIKILSVAGAAQIILAAAVYFAVLYAIRGVTREDLAYVRNLFKA